MKVKSIALSGFRRIEAMQLDLHPKLNIIVGANAQGKTSILESLHALALTKSHKTISDGDMIRTGHETAKISAVCDFDGREASFIITLSKTGKKVKYNRIEMRRLSDYIGRLNVVMFAPEDLELIKGGPRERRRFIDLAIGQLDKPYVHHLSRYRKLLKERNEILKSMQKDNKFDVISLDVVTDQLVHYAAKIVERRKAFIDDLSKRLPQKLSMLAEDDPALSVRYAASIEGDLESAFKQKRTFDIRRATTTIGPHRDDCVFLFDAKPLIDTASQGQIRTVVLAVRLALIDIIRDVVEKTPIILLDDVFSELDQVRVKRIIEQLYGDAQVLLTATDLRGIDVTTLQEHHIITIDDGQITGVDKHGRQTL